MRGTPSLRRRDIVLAAPVLRFNLVQGQLAGTGGFALHTEGLEVVAERGVYEADSTRVLVAEGVVLEERDERARLPQPADGRFHGRRIGRKPSRVDRHTRSSERPN